MGQFDSSNGGKIHLVQDVNDVDILKISQPEKRSLLPKQLYPWTTHQQ